MSYRIICNIEEFGIFYHCIIDREHSANKLNKLCEKV